ncbi:hypothetical protein [Cnuella takakiae]|uniref:hypothetical protein n=1 Tax=Cnuella takakiae TaxID=1302690 RepID=UPI0011608477|nr:hypothetical protein [Cnuella takakiae]
MAKEQQEACCSTKATCREHLNSKAMFYNRKSKCGDMEASDKSGLNSWKKIKAQTHGCMALNNEILRELFAETARPANEKQLNGAVVKETITHVQAD